ncbi:hypothetical protein FY145_14650 [Agrobacterium tumefaciens]|uniref:Uncharacterized protein n=1 Tax=Agrobacterium tumefaciens TaxID=358 RepID=A0AAP9J750_AGRTU|nr:hypothetical protein [Agrobacterium tumefaciens]NSZ59029.1 hypothetical protein [Agrobacterium tumefaciens]QDY95521.1 hypothetical protein CG010_014925 [Agrobacterium tumefaciens]UXS45691.1 hypothetical protein FY149_00005 [Agrobacterium tumefaciens]UXS73667.1 hypothetical protein FY146_24570 [Agrobacterium tumefaciens]UXS79497.1 hypothetical protein FY145_14650 [Agrobacterium tumefaciens]
MIRPWAYLDPKDRETFRTVVAFLHKRLAEQGTIDWVLKLKPSQRVERIAVEDLLTGLGARDLAEPWASAWRLIEESWAAPYSDVHDGTAIYGIQRRLRAGDRSGAAVAAVVDLVAPRLKVEPIDAWRWTYIKKPRKPKTVDHILSAGLTSGGLIDLNVLELAQLNDITFLTSLANALEASVNHGLDTARRLGWDGQKRLWQLGDLSRAYYVSDGTSARVRSDPDAYHHGIAPSVKLLHAIVVRISEIDLTVARSFTRRWRLNSSPVHIRLWAAMSRDEQITPTDEVSGFLCALDQDRFWDVQGFPEIAELRAVRFSNMNAEAQDLIVARIQKGPPRDHWPKKVDATKVKNARLFWSLRELRRIEVGGGVLPDQAKIWLDTRTAQFAELGEMTIDEGFSGGVIVSRSETKGDVKFETVSGIERLKALEVALGTGRRGWDDDPAERANNWINQHGNADKVLADFGTANNGGDDFPKVWNRFGWAHRPPQQGGDATQDAELGEEAGRVLGLLNQLSDATFSSAIEGICAWLDAWDKYAVKLPLTLPIWLRLWPIAVEITNRRPENVEDEDLSVTAPAEDEEREPMDLDTLNTPAGKLVGVFLAACPSLPPEAQAFSADSVERQMRDIVIAAEGRSGLIAKHRMIESLPYFLRADPDWAQEHLIAPLLNDDGAALALWRAVARRTHFTKVLESIGMAMAERVNDRRLDRETRRRLVFSLVIESLHAFRDGRAPAVSNQRIQQMLRTLDDEVRSSAANVVQQFVHELSAKEANDVLKDGEEQEDPSAAAVLFRSSAAPFLREVWPQERSLATPGVSSALADLPATSGEAFAEAVDTIARFLVPFECWSMVNYGLYGSDGEAKKLAVINDDAKARALLKLLDLTVGTSEGAVIPHDLTDALDQILKVDPALSTNAVFRRLATAARR